jgi:putative ABC transport system substrate-binding protein
MRYAAFHKEQPMPFDRLRRRDFITLLCGAALVEPLAARAQEPGRTFRVGMVETISAELNATKLAAFRRGMRELGYMEGRNLVLEYRSADGDATRFPALISELISLNVDLIVTRGTPAALAAKNATSTMPIVAILGDPLLVVASLARPGGNITGLSGVQADLAGKRIEVIKEFAPTTSRIAAILNMSNPIAAEQLKELELAARSRGLQFQLLDVRKAEDFELALASLIPRHDAVFVGLDGLTQAHRKLIADLAAKHRLPAIYEEREFIESGGLMSYAPNITDNYRRAATYVDKIFKGAKPADLPIEQPTGIEFIINGRAAKALGVEIPPGLLLRADEVIE